MLMLHCFARVYHSHEQLLSPSFSQKWCCCDVSRCAKPPIAFKSVLHCIHCASFGRSVLLELHCSGCDTSFRINSISMFRLRWWFAWVPWVSNVDTMRQAVRGFVSPAHLHSSPEGYSLILQYPGRIVSILLFSWRLVVCSNQLILPSDFPDSDVKPKHSVCPCNWNFNLPFLVIELQHLSCQVRAMEVYGEPTSKQDKDNVNTALAVFG